MKAFTQNESASRVDTLIGDLTHVLRVLTHIADRLVQEVELRLRLASLRLANRYKRSPVVLPGGPVVSLTTYGKRVRSVHLAIESIGRGQTLPSRLILWIDDTRLFNELPSGVRRLQKRGLEVKSCNNYGPHTKYYPYLKTAERLDVPLVTADDDLVYPRQWLLKLNEAFTQHPEVVNCHRARRIVLDTGEISQYSKWEAADSTEPSYSNIATGVAGAIYPPKLQHALRSHGEAFLYCCPKADDLWLHVIALRSGYKVRQIHRTRFRHLYIPGTQDQTLCHNNVEQGGNDRQIRATYAASDIARMRTGD